MPSFDDCPGGGATSGAAHAGFPGPAPGPACGREGPRDGSFSEAFRRRYEIGSILGEGGMGVVYLGRQSELNRPVAIKFTQSVDPETRARFAREGRVLAKLRHPNVVQVYEAGEEGGFPFLVFEVVEGEALSERLRREGPLELLEVLDLAAQIAAGVACAHSSGVLHRDLKSANILIASDGSSKVCDFGLACYSGQAQTS